MSAQIKSGAKKAGKIAGIALFVFFMFFSIKFSVGDYSSGDIDLFGLKVSVFTSSAYATGGICPSCPYQYAITLFPASGCGSGIGWACYTYGSECQVAGAGCA